ncbi:hypothetical protein SPLA10_PHROGS00067 [Salmonella phage SPLA10]|nr:hypothetical protein SPLA10_PHROGS00067 [Salmonella phage SPLA10]
MNIVPPLNTKGRFVLRTPWVADPARTYTVIGLRTFLELVGSSVDIYKTYYEPMKVEQSKYEADYKEGATLVILYNEEGGMLFVPSTYIQSFPTQSVPNYANYVLSALLGPFATDYDFGFTTQKVKETLSDTLGYEPEIFIDVIGEAQGISREDADVLEANRQAAIKDRKSTYARNLELEAEAEDLRQQIAALQSVISG